MHVAVCMYKRSCIFSLLFAFYISSSPSPLLSIPPVSLPPPSLLPPVFSPRAEEESIREDRAAGESCKTRNFVIVIVLFVVISIVVVVIIIIWILTSSSSSLLWRLLFYC